MFSLLRVDASFFIDKFVAESTEKSSSFAHNYFKTKLKQSNTLSCITIEYIFPLLRLDTSFFLQSILTLIVQTTVRQCLVHSQSNSKEP